MIHPPSRRPTSRTSPLDTLFCVSRSAWNRAVNASATTMKPCMPGLRCRATWWPWVERTSCRTHRRLRRRPQGARCRAHTCVWPTAGRLCEPCVQIRQMGTPSQPSASRSRGFDLSALERIMVEDFGCKTGLLQAREHAIPFYAAQGWIVIDEPYTIGVIGPHRSMMKAF